MLFGLLDNVGHPMPKACGAAGPCLVTISNALPTYADHDDDRSTAAPYRYRNARGAVVDTMLP